MFGAPASNKERLEDKMLSLRQENEQSSRGGTFGIATTLVLASAWAAHAHGEQILVILGVDAFLFAAVIIFALLWHQPWTAKLLFLGMFVAGVGATHILPFFPRTLEETASYNSPQLLLIFGGPPLAACIVTYIAICLWRQRKKRKLTVFEKRR